MAKLSFKRAMKLAEENVENGEFNKTKKLYDAILEVAPGSFKAQLGFGEISSFKKDSHLKSPKHEGVYYLTTIYNEWNYKLGIQQAKALVKKYPA